MSYSLITANRNYSSWSLRSWVLMKALNIPFTEHIFSFGSPEENFANFIAYSPNAMVPCLQHHEAEDIIVWDSLAIIEYLAEHHEGVWPKEKRARAWARSAAAEMHSGFIILRNLCPMNIGIKAKFYNHFDKKSVNNQTGIAGDQFTALNKDIERITILWNEGLERFKGPWLAGETFTAVDAFYAPVVYRFRTFGFQVKGHAKAWMDAMLTHPAMMQWEQEALAETWREQSHEDEIMNIALITEDHRAI